MSHLTPLPLEQLTEIEPIIRSVEPIVGFLPNSFLLFAHHPRFLKGFIALFESVMGAEGALDPGLKFLIAFMVSALNGCSYDQALSAYLSAQYGVTSEKVRRIFEFEFDVAFMPKERAALDLARCFSRNPHDVMARHFARLRQFFTNEQIVELVSVLALFSWLNYWNATMATDLDEHLQAWVEQNALLRISPVNRSDAEKRWLDRQEEMPYVLPLQREQKPELEPIFAANEAALGFLPNSMLLLAHRPEILKAFFVLARVIMKPGGSLQTELKQLAALVISNQKGCLYCQAHTLFIATREGASTEKLQAVFEFERNSVFSIQEQAALRFARDSSLIPSQVTAKHFSELRRHFFDNQIVELVTVLGLFSWLSYWNITIANKLEDQIRAWVEKLSMSSQRPHFTQLLST